MFFYQGVLPMPSSLHKQSQMYNFVLSEPNGTNTATMKLNNNWSRFMNVQRQLNKQLPQKNKMKTYVVIDYALKKIGH